MSCTQQGNYNCLHFIRYAMIYQLSRLGLAEIRQKNINSQFGGSSTYKAWNNSIFRKDKSPKKSIIEKMEAEALKVVQDEKIKTPYSLRKGKIRNKILNFFNLNASKKFCAFYSISFPKGFPDELCYKIFNTWLTRCRKDCNLKSYLWVAERQKNNTLHFHLITNNFMRISIVNNYMKECIRTQNKKENLGISKYIIDKYNGVDVDNIWESKKNRNSKKRLNKVEATRKISMYLTKYVSKNDTKSDRLPWHCSRDISALFISINYSEVNMLEITDLITNNPDSVISYEKEYFTMHYFKFQPLDEWFNDLTAINNQIYKTFHPN